MSPVQRVFTPGCGCGDGHTLVAAVTTRTYCIYMLTHTHAHRKEKRKWTFTTKTGCRVHDIQVLNRQKKYIYMALTSSIEKKGEQGVFQKQEQGVCMYWTMI